MEVTPDVIRYWLPILFGGQEVERKQLLAAINSHHVSHGGKEKKTIDLVFKKIPSKHPDILKSVPDKKGYWQIFPSKETPPPISLPIPVPQPDVHENSVVKYIIIGEGKECVYLLYYVDSNLYKLGATTTSVESRIQHLKTGSASSIEIKFVIRTADCKKLERAIHEVLKFRNRHVLKRNAGTEMYNTSTQEVLNIYSFLLLT